MTVARHTPQLDGLRAWAAGIGGRWRVVADAPPAEQDKLAWLAAGGRDLLAATPDLRRAITNAIAADAKRVLTAAGNLRTEATLRVAGEVIKAAVVARVVRQGGDVRLAPLSPAYAAWKRRARLDPRIAVATGALLRALRAATFTLRRVG